MHDAYSSTSSSVPWLSPWPTFYQSIFLFLRNSFVLSFFFYFVLFFFCSFAVLLFCFFVSFFLGLLLFLLYLYTSYVCVLFFSFFGFLSFQSWVLAGRVPGVGDLSQCHLLLLIFFCVARGSAGRAVRGDRAVVAVVTFLGETLHTSDRSRSR